MVLRFLRRADGEAHQRHSKLTFYDLKCRPKEKATGSRLIREIAEHTLGGDVDAESAVCSNQLWVVKMRNFRGRTSSFGLGVDHDLAVTLPTECDAVTCLVPGFRQHHLAEDMVRRQVLGRMAIDASVPVTLADKLAPPSAGSAYGSDQHRPLR